MRLKPFLLKPASKDYLWGGNRLNEDFGKNIESMPLAETWECSTHPDGESIVASGDNAGLTLSKLLWVHPEYLGTHSLSITHGKAELPILIKLIDAKKDLSVQVHPDDDYARRFENSMGKTEMWYVLQAKEDSRLVYGFTRDLTKQEVQDAIKSDRLCSLLNYVSVCKNDLFYIEAGTVHAIGAGTLVAEIQENSNLTYRLYDYNRKDKYGNLRELHVDKALSVARLSSSANPRRTMRVLRYSRGRSSELLCRCRYFQVERIQLNTEIERNLVSFQTNSNSFHALLCTDGCGVIFGESGFMLNFFKGDCIFVPANSISLKLHGKAQLLNVNC